MAIVNAVATGNYSNTAVTFGGVTPQVGDTVQTNAFTITLDVPIANIAFIANGGGLSVGQAQIDAHGGLLICDNCTLDYRGTAAAAGLQLTYSSGEFRWTGAATNNSGTGSRYAIRLSLSGTAICRLGSVRGGPSNYTIGAAIVSSGSGVTVYVDQATGGSGLEAFGFGSEFSSGNYLCYITNAIGGNSNSTAAGVGVSQNGSSRFYIENAIPNSAPGLWIGPSVVNVSAWVTNASGSAGGNGSVSPRTPGVRFLSTGLNNFCRVKNLIFGVLGQSPIDGIVFLDPDPTNTVQFRMSDGLTKTLADPATFADSPATSDVRLGTSFNYGSNVGTCAVPLAGQTVVGVPVDDTVGTAVLTQEQLLATLQPNPVSPATRSIEDTKPLTFGWPNATDTVTGEVSIDNGPYVPVAGTVSYLREENGKHYFTLEFDAADRPTEEGTARYIFTSNTYTMCATLRTINRPSSITEVEREGGMLHVAASEVVKIPRAAAALDAGSFQFTIVGGQSLTFYYSDPA